MKVEIPVACKDCKAEVPSKQHMWVNEEYWLCPTCYEKKYGKLSPYYKGGM